MKLFRGEDAAAKAEENREHLEALKRNEELRVQKYDH